MNLKRWFLLSVLLVLVLAACNGDEKKDEENNKGGEATPVTAATLLENAATKIDEANTFEMVLEANGAPVALNAAAVGLNADLFFKKAQGVFVAPDSLGGVVEIALDEVVTELEIIIVGNDQFLKQSLITQNKWQAVSISPDFTPASLKGDTGIASAIRSLQNPEYVGEEDLDGLPVHHLRGEIDAALVQSVTVGFIGTSEGNIQADLYIRTDNGLLEKLVLEEPLAAESAEPTTWTISLYNYNEDFVVEAPEVE